jgi:hypothetical protein
MVANQIEARRRNKRGEFFNQFERFENNVGGSVPPAVLEAIQQPAIRQKRQSLGGHRGAAGVSAQTLESHTVMGGNADVGMNAVAGNCGAARAGGDGDVLQIDRVAHLGDPAASARPGGYEPANRGAIELSEQRLAVSEGIGFVTISLGPQAATFEEFGDFVLNALGQQPILLILTSVFTGAFCKSSFRPSCWTDRKVPPPEVILFPLTSRIEMPKR